MPRIPIRELAHGCPRLLLGFGAPVGPEGRGGRRAGRSEDPLIVPSRREVGAAGAARRKVLDPMPGRRAPGATR